MKPAFPVLAALMLATFFTAAPSSQAQEPRAKDVAQVLASTVCTPVAVAAFDVRIHIRCSVPVSGIYYFAVPTSEANRAARALALFSTALASGHDVRIYYDPANTTGTAIGCQSGDCRLADAVEML